jgi:hypothetical protein
MPDQEKGRHKPMRCRFGLHRYAKRVPASGGEPYLECTRCGKETFRDSIRPIGSGN